MMAKKRNIYLFQICLIYAKKPIFSAYIQGTCTGRYFQTISVADEGPDEMTCFPTRLRYLSSFFFEKVCINGDISRHANFRDTFEILVGLAK